MQLKSTISHKFKLLLILIFISDFVLAQAPSVTSFSPTTVTRRTEVTILGSNFTSTSTVFFGGTAASGVTYVNSGKLIAVVNTGSGGNVTVTNSSGSGSLGGLTYVAPVSPANTNVTGIITDWEGYWNSSFASSNALQQPDTHHSLLAFQHNGTIYSTGVNNNTLSANNVSYTAGDFKALPVSSITGNTAASNYIALGNKIDGNAAATDYLSPAVNGLTVQDVLIDGTNGLGLGSGVTNINSSAVLLFTVDGITNNKINDSQPDILITQIADPTQNAYDIFCFVDTAGNIIGNPVQANFYNVPAVGTYKLDLFTLATGQPYTTVTPSANGAAGGNIRDIRLLAFKLSDFGLSPSNSNSVYKLKYMPSGNSDPAFMAYNAGAVSIPAPVITQQPLSQVICPGEGSITFSVTATGSELSYQWRKNSINIPGATGATYTINDPQESDVAAYSVVVTNPSGSVVSNIVYLNTIISLQPESTSVCANATHTISFTSNGANLTYQWYSNTSQSNSGGIPVPNATNSFYQPQAAVPGTYFYYCEITNNGLGCAGATTDAVSFTVYAAPVAGTASQNITVCEGSTTTVSVSGATGNIQWQQSLNNSSWSNINGATTATYETPALTQTTYYRARVTSGPCTAATSATITVTVTSAPVAGTISGTQEICPDTTADLNLSGYSGNIQWQQSASGTDGWVNVTGGVHPTEAGYTSAAITETTHYRAVVSNGGCEDISGTVTLTVKANIWTGALSSDWHTAGNWECNVPGQGHIVIIPQALNNPMITEGQAHAKTVTLEEGATLTVATGNSLTIKGSITVNPAATFTIEDDANLIQVDDAANTGNITLHKNSSQLFRLDYTFWSSPVEGQQLYAFSPNTQITPQSRFYTYNTAASSFASLDPFNNAFESGKGYLIRMPNEDDTPGYNAGETSIVFEGIFTGVPNNGTVTTTVSTEGVRYNAVGNPYPSPISVRDFFIENSGALEPGEALYFWRKRNNANATSYAVLTLAGYVSNSAIGGNDGEEQFGGWQWSAYFNEQANTNWVIRQGQGFFIKASETAENIVFKNSMRRDGYNTAFFRMNNDNPMSRFWLDITNSDNEFSQTAVVYTEEGTLGIDAGWDGRRMASGNLSIYSIADEDTFAIQARPAFEAADVVPIGYKAGAEGEYTINISRQDGVFVEGQKIFLKDYEAGITHNLTDNTYTFTTGAGTFANRFEIVYTTGDELQTETANASQITVVKRGTGIEVTCNEAIKDIKLFDTRGRLLHSAAVNAFTATADKLLIERQVLIVQITTFEDKIFSTKIVL